MSKEPSLQHAQMQSCFLRFRWISAMVFFGVFFLWTIGCNRDPNARKQKYLESGERYEKIGKHHEALIQFANAIKIDGDFAAAHYDTARTYLALGEGVAAYPELLRTVELSPSNLQARLLLGQIELAGGMPDDALDQAHAILAADSGYAEAYALMAGVQTRKGNRLEAIEDMRHALAITPNSAAFHMQVALLQESSPAGASVAEDELRRAIALDPKNDKPYLLLGALLDKMDKPQEAVSEDETAVRLAPSDLQARRKLADLYLRHEDRANAERVLKRAAEDNASDTVGANMLKDYYLQLQQPDAAEAAYSDLRARYPQSRPLKIAYADILLTLGKFDRLRPLLSDLTKANDFDTEVEMLASALLVHDGKSRDALERLQKAANNAPEDDRLRAALGTVAADLGDLGLSVASYQEAIRLQPHNLKARVELAKIVGRSGNSVQLAQIADQTLKVFPEYAPAYLWRATAESDKTQYREAEQDIQTVLARDPNDLTALNLLAEVKLQIGKTSEALSISQRVLKKEPDSSPALHMLTVTCPGLKQCVKAVVFIKEQIAKMPRSLVYYHELASIEIATKDFVDARNTSRTALRVDPSDERSVASFAEASQALGDFDSAIDAWKQWGTTHPNSPKTSSMLALLEEQKGDSGQAITYYEESLKAEPAQALVQNNLAYLMVENGRNLAEALQLAQSARRSLPQSPSTADTLAWVYFHQQHYGSARDLLEDASKVEPANAAIQYHLGLTYSRIGNKAQAAIHLSKAMRLAPDHRIGKEAAAAMGTLNSARPLAGG